MDLYNLWLHHRLCVCFPSCTFSHPQPSMHFVLQGGNEMRAPLQFLFFHKVRQGATGREINCLWLSRDPQNAAVSLSSVQKWLWVFWFRLVWYGSLFNQFVKSLEQEFNAYRTLKVLPLATMCLSSSCFTLYCHLFCVTDSVDFISPFQKISLQLKGSLTQVGLLCFLDSPRIKYCTQRKDLISDFFPYLNLTVNCIKVLRTIGLWGCVGMQGCLSTTKELCEKTWNKWIFRNVYEQTAGFF